VFWVWVFGVVEVFGWSVDDCVFEQLSGIAGRCENPALWLFWGKLTSISLQSTVGKSMSWFGFGFAIELSSLQREGCGSV
jgi:hypothetical protein